MKLCAMCRTPTENGKRRCPRHEADHRADTLRRRKARDDAGLCSNCGGPRDAQGKLCAACLAYFRERLSQRKASGLCVRCGYGAKATVGVMCRRCWFKKMAADCANARGPANDVLADGLETLWEKQRGLCALTGVEIVPGETASLDHILPRSRGGTDDLKNLQWVEFHINIAKRDLTPTEFVQLCRRVARHASRSSSESDGQGELFG